jgi:hypothetical protein
MINLSDLSISLFSIAKDNSGRIIKFASDIPFQIGLPEKGFQIPDETTQTLNIFGSKTEQSPVRIIKQNYGGLNQCLHLTLLTNGDKDYSNLRFEAVESVFDVGVGSKNAPFPNTAGSYYIYKVGATTPGLTLNKNNEVIVWNKLGVGGTPGAADSFQTGAILQVYGKAWKNTGGATWSYTSDVRLKKDIVSLTGTEAINKLLSIYGKKFKWKNPSLHQNQTSEVVGLIAQEIEQNFPLWVEEIDCGSGNDVQELNGTSAKTIAVGADFFALVIESIRYLKNRLDSQQNLT